MREQWGTMKRAFSDLAKERNGHISLEELQNQIKFWGITLDP
jgi:Ca2+-binding EF-hand superfamily protein